ncbi:hypothetical protein [Methylomagnum sp.]
MWQAEFSSDKFLPYLPEECQANPGVYGFELACWLARALAKRGVVTSYPLGEDWGWLIEYSHGEIEFTIGCASLADEGEGYAGEAIQWRVFVRPHLTFKQRLKGGLPDGAAQHLTQAIIDALAAEGISVEK